MPEYDQPTAVRWFSFSAAGILLITGAVAFAQPGIIESPAASTVTAATDDWRTTLTAPPREEGEFRTPDLVDLEQLEPSLGFDIRYATANNFAGRPVYSEARAFLQRPAAEALVRAHRKLQEQGYAIIVFDGYRPWSVTKLFWNITPPEKKEFVADPAKGSRHNRGCAVDVTLCDLATSKPVAMPGEYDEMTSRSYPTYPGGTRESRRNRDTLRAAMEAEGFKVYDTEWWHFDYKDWRRYPILNISFSEIPD